VVQGKVRVRIFVQNPLIGGVPTQCWRDQTLVIVCTSSGDPHTERTLVNALWRVVRLVTALKHGLTEASYVSERSFDSLRPNLAKETKIAIARAARAAAHGLKDTCAQMKRRMN
jgi:hypothetical protein